MTYKEALEKLVELGFVPKSSEYAPRELYNMYKDSVYWVKNMTVTAKMNSGDTKELEMVASVIYVEPDEYEPGWYDDSRIASDMNADTWLCCLEWQSQGKLKMLKCMDRYSPMELDKCLDMVLHYKKEGEAK